MIQLNSDNVYRVLVITSDEMIFGIASGTVCEALINYKAPEWHSVDDLGPVGDRTVLRTEKRRPKLPTEVV